MNEDILKGKWKEVKGSIKEKWGNLADDDLAAVEGTQEKLVGLLQKNYGYSKEKATQEFQKFIGDYKNEYPPSKT